MSSYGTPHILTLLLPSPHPTPSQLVGGPFSNSLSIVDVLYCWEVTLSLVRVLKMLAHCQRKNTADFYVAYTIRSQDTGKLFITELGQFPTCGPPFCHEEGLTSGLTLALLLSILIFLW